MSSENTILPISPEWLNPVFLVPYIYGNETQAWYWSDDWDPDFYVSLARAGFISICSDHFDGRMLLLPQMHIESAVLDWRDRRLSRSLFSAIRSGICDRLSLTLRVTRDPGLAMRCLGECWEGESWLHAPYRKVMNQLASRTREYSFSGDSPSPPLIPVGVELWSSRCDRPVAGELGYITGSVYTSLSGFMHPDRRAWNNCGKLQLHALAVLLERSGFSFWNLGQPQMQYKRDLGARVTPRKEFLERWLGAVGKPVPTAFNRFLETDLELSSLFSPDGCSSLLSADRPL